MTPAPALVALPDSDGLARAAALLRDGHLVAFPTETVYGLGANALDPSAVARIYEAKGRPGYNPLIVHVPDIEAARGLTSRWTDEAERLARRWWPGPLTMVLPRSAGIPDAVSAGLETVGLRVPAHPVALALLKQAGMPLAAPSANRSGEVSPTTAAHVQRSLGERVSLILDGGPTTVGIESTVIDLSGSVPVLLRPGMLSREMLSTVIGTIASPSASDHPGGARPSPGMLDRHYAPKARLLLVPDPAGSQVRDVIARTRAAGGPVGLLSWSGQARDADLVERLPSEAAGFARELYGALHRLDDAGAAIILVETLPPGGEWDAIRDRLTRAARS